LAIWTGQEQISHVLKAADVWRQNCLLGDGSVFSNHALWTNENVEELKELFVNNPIDGNKKFYVKLREQIGGAKPAICQLASEAFWLLVLFVSEKSFGVEKKRERISEVWEFSTESIPDSEQLASDCLRGIAKPGTSFLARIWAEYAFLIQVVEAWKALPREEQSRLLTNNPWDLCRWVTSNEGGDVRGFRHMFLYFCYPAFFERICSRNHKKKIYTAFADKLEIKQDYYKLDKSPCGLDRSIFEIRETLQAEYNSAELDFYLSPLRTKWLRKEEDAEADDEASTDASAAQKKFWVEKTIVKGRADREQGPHCLGAALWSPQKSKDGKDIYANMRAVSTGDVVYHLTDNSGFTGVSVVASRATEDFVGLEGTAWGGQPSYRVAVAHISAYSTRTTFIPHPLNAFDIRSVSPAPINIAELTEGGSLHRKEV
jgi:hypothetical protein